MGPPRPEKALDKTEVEMKHTISIRHTGLWQPDFQHKTASPPGTPFRTAQLGKFKSKDGPLALLLNSIYLA